MLILLFVLVATGAAHADPLLMAPDPLGDWVTLTPDTRTAQVSRVSGDSVGPPTIVLRVTVGSSTALPRTTVNFNYHFDEPIASVMAVGTTGPLYAGPLLLGGTVLGDSTLAFACDTVASTCTVDVEYTFASVPTSVEVTDTINAFANSAGAPSQMLAGTLAIIPNEAPVLGPLGLVVLCGGLAITGRRAA
jgi:hypothetical protein